MRALALALALGLCACNEGAPPDRMLSTDGGTLTYFVQTDGFDGTDEFPWDISSDQAYVRFDRTSLTHGSVQLSFVSAEGAIIYNQPISIGTPPASGATSHGPGPWNVRLDFTSATGTIAFTAVPAR